MERQKKTYIFDTNIYRKVARQAVQIPPALHKLVAVSEYTALELLEQFQSSTRENFAERKAALELARKHAQVELLFHPAHFLRQEVLGRNTDGGHRKHLLECIEAAVRIWKFEQLTSGVEWRGKTFKLADLQAARQRRHDWWIQGLSTAKSSLLELQSLPSPAIGGPLTGEDAKKVNQHFTQRWPGFYAQSMARRLGLSEPSEESLDLLGDRLSAAVFYLGEVIRSTVVDGYRFQESANDVADYHQLHYLFRQGVILVTADGRLRRRVSRSPQASRIVTFEEFLAEANAEAAVTSAR